jgi:hypothetical protein
MTAVSLPQDIASSTWQKRMNVMAVLDNSLPMEFADSDEVPLPIPCNECEIIIDEANDLVLDQRPSRPIPHTASDAQPSATATHANRAQTGGTAKHIAKETGLSGARA